MKCKKISKSKIYFWVKKNINSNTIKVFLLFLVLCLYRIFFSRNDNFDINEFIDFSIVGTFFLVGFSGCFANCIRKFVFKKTEDAAKLDEKYDELSKKYSCNNLVKYQDVIFPEECLWIRKGDEKIIVEDNPDKFYNLPNQVAENSKELMEVHSESKIYNQINIRLDNIKVDENQVVLQTSRTHYFDSLLTNRASDCLLSNRKYTIREIYEPGPFMKPLHLSKMSNHIGFNGFVITSDNKTIPFILRKNNLSIAKSRWSTSVSASLKAMYAIEYANEFKLTENSLANSIIGEIKSELHISNDKALTIENVKKSIFAFYREYVECGKPQFVFCLELQNITENEMRKAITKNNRNNILVDGNEVCFFSIRQLKDAKIYVNKIEIEGKVYKMTPSAIVSVIFLLKYYDE